MGIIRFLVKKAFRLFHYLNKQNKRTTKQRNIRRNFTSKIVCSFCPGANSQITEIPNFKNSSPSIKYSSQTGFSQ